MNDVRNERLTWLFAIAEAFGRKPVVDVLLATAADEKADPKHRALSFAALESNVDTSSDAHLKSFLDIAKSGAPDEVKLGALQRMNAYPPDVAAKAYYELFDSPNWKVRYGGAMRILDLLAKVGDRSKTTPAEFFSKLPTSDKTKFAIGEPTAYASVLSAMPPELRAKEAVDEAIKTDKLGALMTAIGWYYHRGTKDDLPMLAKFEKNKSPVPKCSEEDECGWASPGCPVPKAGSDEVEYKPVSNVAEYVQFCVVPEIEKRAKAPAAPAEEKK
jgi:hypothetical protein